MFKIRKRNLRKISVNVSVFLIFIFAAFAPVYAQEEAGQYNEYLKANESVKVSYSTHVQKKGWQAAVANGERAGTMGLNLRMEALRINVDNIKNYSGDIIYRSHIQTYGWEGEWKKNNEVSGTTGKGKRLEAIQIKLTKDLEKKYDIYYRVHAQTYGWLGWAKNGTSAGTVGCSKRIEAIEIVMVDKGERPPGKHTTPVLIIISGYHIRRMCRLSDGRGIRKTAIPQVRLESLKDWKRSRSIC